MRVSASVRLRSGAVEVATPVVGGIPSLAATSTCTLMCRSLRLRHARTSMAIWAASHPATRSTS